MLKTEDMLDEGIMWVLRSKTLGEATVPLKMARDEARHGKALKGLLERYFK